MGLEILSILVKLICPLETLSSGIGKGVGERLELFVLGLGIGFGNFSGPNAFSYLVGSGGVGVDDSSQTFLEYSLECGCGDIHAARFSNPGDTSIGADQHALWSGAGAKRVERLDHVRVGEICAEPDLEGHVFRVLSSFLGCFFIDHFEAGEEADNGQSLVCITILKLLDRLLDPLSATDGTEENQEDHLSFVVGEAFSSVVVKGAGAGEVGGLGADGRRLSRAGEKCGREK